MHGTEQICSGNLNRVWVSAPVPRTQLVPDRLRALVQAHVGKRRSTTWMRARNCRYLVAPDVSHMPRLRLRVHMLMPLVSTTSSG
eukprot:CAMPEP_0117517798 /NCGR_PEP_ID=MMETSP0784-20121206/31798_1 /TAXON_ID=39447 /ORGANISM="" /LENGTH=84 /DNA_ID=CAMNT_0005313691 /DNA_START=51 /DNA_END=301 /DNA_ORIENTATION=-